MWMLELTDWEAEDLAGVLRAWQRGEVYPPYHGLADRSIASVVSRLPKPCACLIHPWSKETHARQPELERPSESHETIHVQEKETT